MCDAPWGNSGRFHTTLFTPVARLWGGSIPPSETKLADAVFFLTIEFTPTLFRWGSGCSEKTTMMKKWLFTILLIMIALIHIIVEHWISLGLYLALMVLDFFIEEKEGTPVFDDDSILDSNYQSLR
jgi:hypothetical protein